MAAGAPVVVEGTIVFDSTAGLVAGRMAADRPATIQMISRTFFTSIDREPM
jgi:hypothetical protein